MTQCVDTTWALLRGPCVFFFQMCNFLLNVSFLFSFYLLTLLWKLSFMYPSFSPSLSGYQGRANKKINGIANNNISKNGLRRNKGLNRLGHQDAERPSHRAKSALVPSLHLSHKSFWSPCHWEEDLQVKRSESACCPPLHSTHSFTTSNKKSKDADQSY